MRMLDRIRTFHLRNPKYKISEQDLPNWFKGTKLYKEKLKEEETPEDRWREFLT